MKIQKSRNSRQPAKDYSAVCHQQGRMLTDSDLTEQALLARDRLSAALQDVIGSGTPRQGALLQVTESGDQMIPSLHWGRVYVDGVQAQVRAAADASDPDQFAYAHQLYYPEAPALPAGAHRLYVDVWERSVGWLHDDLLRDPGLHGADTSTRTQTLAQVKWCAPELDPLCEAVNPRLGDARLRLELRSLATSADPCDPCADELELNEPVGNYLFRAEVHDVEYDADDQPRALVLKWSSENGAEAYASADVPPDFAANRFVYEFFDEITEQRLGAHLGRDGANLRLIDGQRPGLVSVFSAAAPEAKAFVRRWDGWCRIEKSGSDWQLSAGFEGSIDLTSGVGADKPGHVTQGGATVGIELRVLSLAIELADHPLLAGDYWTVPVREVIHQQGEVLLVDPDTDAGLPPRGEPHHYLLLAEVAADASLSLPDVSECDPYQACQPFQFPSLTDLRAADICFDNQVCEMPEVGTVQDALDRLCQERDLRWHNKHLHGWGIVCGLALECDPNNPTAVLLREGYALDCDGEDMVVEGDFRIDILQRLEEERIDPSTLGPDQGLCLYLEFDEAGELDVGIEVYDPDDQSWIDRLRDSLLFDFYDDCILGLIRTVTGELEDTEVVARCALTKCGHEQIRPLQRRTLTLANLLFLFGQGEAAPVLNLSPCEHALLKDLYERLREHLRSKTFCGQFQQLGFPDYPFADSALCRATWFTPEPLDHIRLHPEGRLAFGWRRSSNRVFLFEQLKEGCLGDLVGWFDVPQVEKGSITDLSIDRDNLIHLVAVVHEEDTLFARGKLPPIVDGDCEIEIDWETSFMCGVKVVLLKPSPWNSKQFFALGLCRGAYLIESDKLFAEDKIEREPDWAFAASGHLEFDLLGARVLATAAKDPADCAQGQYNRLALFGAELLADAQAQPVQLLVPIVNKQPVRGSDGFVLAPAAGVPGGDDVPVTGVPGAAQPKLNLVLYLAADFGDLKTLCRFDARGLKPSEGQTQVWNGQAYHSFGAAGHLALKYVRAGKLDGVVATRYAMHDLEYIPGDPERYKDGLLSGIPVQAGPVDLAVHDKREQLHVLNHLGQSITVLNYELATYQQEREILRQYRADVIAAYFQLLSGMLQYLKDCFCHHLLVKCPECDPEDKVYLGCLTLREGEVYHICNFTKRRYLKTFTTFSYWLSLIPIGPLVGWAVERFCCLVLPDFFREKKISAFGITPMQMGTASAVVNTDHSQMLQAVSLAGQGLAKKSADELISAGYKDRSSYQDLVGVEYRYKPGVVQPIPLKARSNDEVLAKVDKLDRKTEQSMTSLQTEVETLRYEKAVAEERFEILEADYQNVTVKRLREMEVEKQRAEQEVAELQEEVIQLKAVRSETEQRFVEMEKTLVELGKLRTEVHPVIAGAQPVATIDGLNAETALILESNHITTVRALAEADVTRLKELGIRHNTAVSLVRKANEKLKPR